MSYVGVYLSLLLLSFFFFKWSWGRDGGKGREHKEKGKESERKIFPSASFILQMVEWPELVQAKARSLELYPGFHTGGKNPSISAQRDQLVME